jgi:putative ABC transport system permease protein
MTRLLHFAAQRCVPLDWRASVMADLEDEAGRRDWGETRMALHLASLGIRMRLASAFDAFACDVRFAFRSLLTARWFTAGAILTFALGIGVNVAVFSAVDRLLFRPLPYAEPERLVLLRECNLRTGACVSGSFPSSVAFSLQNSSTTIADVAVAGFSRAYTRDREGGLTQDERFQLVGVSARTLRVLGVSPQPGRDISEAEIRERTPVAWISHETWRARFSSDPAVIGRLLWSGRASVTIIGVLPPGFIIPALTSSQAPDWAGLVFDHNEDLWAALPATGRTMNPVARLRPGRSVDAAQAELDELARSTVAQVGLSNSTATPTRLRVLPLQREIFSAVRPYVWMVVATAWLVLLIACVNLANLFLARGRSREHFAAVASALGASSTRLVTASIAESLLVCITGAALAWAALTATQQVLSAVLPRLFSRYAAGFTDLRVLGFAVLVTFATAFLSGFIPGLRLARVGILRILQRGSGRESHGHRPGATSLLAVEGALGALLVLGAALTGRSFIALTADDLGLQPQELYGISVAGSRLQASTNTLTIDQTLEAVRQLPGVESVAAGDWSPVGTAGAPFFGVALDAGRIGFAQVSRDFFATLRNPFIAGRMFTAEEQAARADVVILNRAAARLLWPDRDPAAVIGETWRLDKAPARRVIGITADTKTTYGELEPASMAFLPLGAQRAPLTSLLVRMHSGRQLQMADVQAALRTSAGVTTFRLSYVPESMDFALRDPRFRAVLLTVLAITGLVLAAAGLFAVVSYSAATRTYEMGVRLTLGAVPHRLSGLMLRDACVPVVTGMVVGLAAAWWMSTLAQDLLFRTNARDPIHYVIVAAVLVATTVLAAWVPASRAARVNPVTLLKVQ